MVSKFIKCLNPPSVNSLMFKKLVAIAFFITLICGIVQGKHVDQRHQQQQHQATNTPSPCESVQDFFDSLNVTIDTTVTSDITGKFLLLNVVFFSKFRFRSNFFCFFLVIFLLIFRLEFQMIKLQNIKLYTFLHILLYRREVDKMFVSLVHKETKEK